MIVGHNTWVFHNQPTIISTGVVGGPFEAQGKISDDFDILHEDLWLNQDSFEKAQRTLMEEACQIAVKKVGIEKENIDYFIGGDLINQITPTTFAAKTLGIPYFGIFSACATSMESLALSAFIVNAGGARFILSGTASHHAATERQFRFPTEYGGQLPPSAQWTVTGAGCALVTKEGAGPKITSATIGKVVDMGLTDPYNMGGAMAPAAVDTIICHLTDQQVDPNHYDLIITGDLGKIGRESAYDLLQKKGVHIHDRQFVDCGLTIYKENQPVHAGASGTASSAVATYGHFLNRMRTGELKRILVVATGALHSPLSVQQNEPIPCIAHAVALEMGGITE